MKLSLFSDYALRVLMFAALKADDFRVDEVTAAYGISRNHVAKIIHRLAQLGYLETRRGRGGGIRLARPAAEIRIGKLVRQTEAQPVLVECFDPRTNTCPVSGTCYLKGALGEAMNAFYATLDRHTLESITTGPKRLALVRTLLPALHAGAGEAKTGIAEKTSVDRS
jgi:Rrf2 family nitric oxide-sensitive transcriptional repressor